MRTYSSPGIYSIPINTDRLNSYYGPERQRNPSHLHAERLLVNREYVLFCSSFWFCEHQSVSMWTNNHTVAKDWVKKPTFSSMKQCCGYNRGILHPFTKVNFVTESLPLQCVGAYSNIFQWKCENLFIHIDMAAFHHPCHYLSLQAIEPLMEYLDTNLETLLKGLLKSNFDRYSQFFSLKVHS